VTTHIIVLRETARHERVPSFAVRRVDVEELVEVVEIDQAANLARATIRERKEVGEQPSAAPALDIDLLRQTHLGSLGFNLYLRFPPDVPAALTDC